MRLARGRQHRLIAPQTLYPGKGRGVEGGGEFPRRAARRLRHPARRPSGDRRCYVPHYEPRDLDEAARTDGATTWQASVRVVLPVAAPGLAATAILTFIIAWNEFLLALILTSREARTLPVAIVGFLAYEGADWGLVSSGSVLVMAPIVVFTLLIRKYLVQGLVGGALKG